MRGMEWGPFGVVECGEDGDQGRCGTGTGTPTAGRHRPTILILAGDVICRGSRGFVDWCRTGDWGQGCAVGPPLASETIGTLERVRAPAGARGTTAGIEPFPSRLTAP